LRSGYILESFAYDKPYERFITHIEYAFLANYASCYLVCGIFMLMSFIISCMLACCIIVILFWDCYPLLYLWKFGGRWPWLS